MEKTCKKCGVTHSTDSIEEMNKYFRYHNKSLGKLEPRCKACRKEEDREMAKNRPELVELKKEYGRTYSKIYRDEINAKARAKYKEKKKLGGH
jgi:hypothetical protein